MKIKSFAMFLANNVKYYCRSENGFDSLGDIAQIFLDAAQVSKVAVEKQGTDESKH